MESNGGLESPPASEVALGSAPNGEENGQLSADASLGKRFWNVQTLVSFVIAFGVLILLFTRVQIDFAGTARAILGANPLYYLLGLVVYYTVFPIRALRWRQMLLNAGSAPEDVPGTGTLAEIIFLSWFVNCLVPAKLGDVYRAYLLKRRSALSGSKAGGTIVAERLLDLTTLLLLAGTAGLVALWGQREKLATLVLPLEIISALILVAALGLVAMRLWSSWLRGLLPPQLRGLYARFVEGAVGSFGSYQLILPYSLLAWLAEAARLYLVVKALGLTLGASPSVEVAVVVAVALVGSLLTALPLTPAGLGFVESGLVGALLLVGVGDQSVAISIAVLDRTISYVSLVAIGLVVYLIGSRRGGWFSR
jgi:glycosyltransferase 2 family protein